MSNSSSLDDTDDSDLAYVRTKRKQLIDAMSKGGAPEDPKDKVILLAALADMDRTTLSKKKIKSDEGMSNAHAAAAETIAQLFMDARTKQLGRAKAGEVGEIKKLDDAVPLPTLVEGELDDDAGSMNYETFMSKQLSP